MSLNQRVALKKIQDFLDEDLQNGDLTASVIPHKIVAGSYLAKADGIFAGEEIPELVFAGLNTYNHSRYKTEIISHFHDGEPVKKGDILASLSGDAQDILAAERLSLNLMQRMSGIATQTNLAIKALNDPTINILDTRKTAPGLRLFDKYAVTCGGGLNHRMGLYDAVMLKDNHWKMIGGLGKAVAELRKNIGPTKIIEVEVENKEELLQAIAAQVEIIMFDNQAPEVVAEWRKLVPREIKVEISGGITNETIHNYAGSGADFISLGYLTNSVQNLDISFNLDEN